MVLKFEKKFENLRPCEYKNKNSRLKREMVSNQKHFQPKLLTGLNIAKKRHWKSKFLKKQKTRKKNEKNAQKNEKAKNAQKE